MVNSQPYSDLMLAIEELSQRYPDSRFGQLVSNVAGWADQEIWDVEDEQLLQAVRLHLQGSEQLPAQNSDIVIKSE